MLLGPDRLNQPAAWPARPLVVAGWRRTAFDPSRPEHLAIGNAKNISLLSRVINGSEKQPTKHRTIEHNIRGDT